MATAEEKQAKAAAQQAETQAVVAQRARREAGPMATPKLRSAGDLSRYRVGYSDDPFAAPFEGGSSGDTTALPPPRQAPTVREGGTRTTPGRKIAAPRSTPPLPRTPRQVPRVQPGTELVRTPSGGYRVVSGGKVPQTGALYETNPKTSVTPASARKRFGQIKEGQLARSTPAVQKVTSSTGVTRKVSSGKTAQSGMLYEGGGGKIKSAAPAKKPVVTAKAVAAKKAAAPAPRPTYKPTKK